MSEEIKPGDRFRLPSGNTVEVTAEKAEQSEFRCRYVEIRPLPAMGDGLKFGESCVLSVDFLLELGERV